MSTCRSLGVLVERKTNKKTAGSDQPAARDEPIRLDRGEVNRVRRIGAFSRDRLKKLPWETYTPPSWQFLSSGQMREPQRAWPTHVKAACTSGAYPRATDARCEIRYNCVTLLPSPKGVECDLGRFYEDRDTIRSISCQRRRPGWPPAERYRAGAVQTRMKHLGSRLASLVWEHLRRGSGYAQKQRTAVNSLIGLP